MKKYVFILNAIALLEQLVNGKRVEGVLYLDKDTGKLTFKAYNRQSKKRRKDRLVCPLATGWLREGAKNYKFYSSVKKELGVVQVTEVMNRELEEATKAMVREKLEEFHIKTIDEIMDEV